MLILRSVAALALFAPFFTGQEIPAASDLFAHEWGTFTSVAGVDGVPVQWAPLSGTPDLPCFVDHLSPGNLKYAPGLVRMETPVLYFYSIRPLVASVSVQFPRGRITEWYPSATKVQPEVSGSSVPGRVSAKARIDWESIQISPSSTSAFPSSAGPSRYFAARNTDSTPIQIAKQTEKFIFYRGMGDFDIALQPKFLPSGMLQLGNAGSEAIALAIVFENHSGVIGYQVVHGLINTADVDTSQLAGTLDSLRQELTGDLVEFGLYQKEAAAMLDTWQDSWFEEGMRVFYIVPRPTVDSVLPLTITPSPAVTSRVFVGRVELLSPRVRETIATALHTGDVDTLAKFDRFLSPFMQQLNSAQSGVQPPATNQYLQLAYTKIAQELKSATCVK